MRIAAGALIASIFVLPLAVYALGWQRRVARAALALGAASFALAAIPTLATLREAQSRGIPISLRDALIGSAPPSNQFETLIFAPGLSADLYRPKEHPNGVAIVVVHGGAWVSGDKGENVAWNAWLAERGYVVFDVQYRLAPQATWQESVADVAAAVGWLREHAPELGIDARRVALLGRSSGAHLSLLAAHSAPVMAVVALYPPTDLASPAASPAQIRQEGAPPTLLLHGTWDELVPFDQSVRMAHTLEAAHVSYELVAVPWARHAFDLVFDSPASQLARGAVDTFLASQ